MKTTMISAMLLAATTAHAAPSRTQTAIQNALKQGATKNYIDPMEANAIAKAAKLDGKKSIRPLATLLGRAPMAFGNTDLAGANHRSAVLSEKGGATISQAYWQTGNVIPGDISQLEVSAMKRGDLSSIRTGNRSQVEREASNFLNANYQVRMSGIDEFAIKRTQLPTNSAPSKMENVRQTVLGMKNPDLYRFMAAGQVVYAVALHGAQNSAWMFDSRGNRLGFTRPTGGGEP